MLGGIYIAEQSKGHNSFTYDISAHDWFTIEGTNSFKFRANVERGKNRREQLK
jgi:hypothetical protein